MWSERSRDHSIVFCINQDIDSNRQKQEKWVVLRGPYMFYKILHIIKEMLRYHPSRLVSIAKNTLLHVSYQMGLDARKPVFGGFANNKGADQPAHTRSLISTFVIRYLESIISRLASSEISTFSLVFVAEETGLNLTFSETPKTGFLASMPK